ncbi:MAG TPA: ABC transporter permease subunit [Anaerolineae bacterium]|nr:ABC transporter permease subunit [Anaerolineae bacterium]
MTAGTGASQLAPSFPPIPLRRRLYGFGSIYGKTIRDSRLAFLIMSGLVVGFMFAIGQAFGTAYSTPGSRVELVNLVESVPPILAGMAGNTVSVDTMGGFLTYKYGPFFAFLAGMWSIMALAGSLAGEARRGSLDIVAVAPFGKRRIALEKLLAHVTMLGLAMALLALAAWVAGAAFGTPGLGDEIPPLAAVGFALWVGLIALASGSVAFALAPLVGRGAAAGIAGIVLLGGFVVGNYAPYVPALDLVANLSWFGWTYDHVPLAGQFDWLSVAAVGAIAIVLLAVGVELFARRDLGVTSSLPVPGLPRATLGLRGPVGRAAGDQLPLALGWGLAIGVFGFVIAASSQSFTDELLTESPSIAEILRVVFPNVDFFSAGGFLQLIFVEVGLIVVGLSAATFVSKWASDESSGRLEMLLTTPLERSRWALAGGVGALIAVAASMLIYAAGIGLGAAFAGSDAVTPAVGALVMSLFAAAMVGVGIAIGGVLRTSLAAELVTVVVIATFLVNLLAPALSLPEWFHSLALTAHLGQPMLGMWNFGGIVACLVLAAGGIALGAWGMRRRDVA